MAGIGFELKKLFKRKGVFALLQAYGYAGVICTGPMLLGLGLLLGVHFISDMAGLTGRPQDLLTAMITYTLLASMVVTNGIGMVTTRYTADCLYEEMPEKVMPSFYGSLGIMLAAGGFLYLVFLCFAGITPKFIVVNFVLFGESLLVWEEMNYLTAIKDYAGILKAFFVSVAVGLITGYLLTCVLHFPAMITLLSCVALAYGIMGIWYYVLLVRYFPAEGGSMLEFLKYMDKFQTLFFCGCFITTGMFAHLVMMWFSPLGVQIQGLYYMAPQYDIPALTAFLCTLASTVNFVTSVEVNFYPKYRNYFSLFNDMGSLMDIEQAEREMKTTLWDELSYTAAKQVFVTILFVVVGTMILPNLPLGYNEEMLGIFRVLCTGYAFYAVGNCVMLMDLYYADNKGASATSAVFAVVSVIGTIVVMRFPIRYYGLGFVVGGCLFMITALVRLWLYQRRIRYHVLCAQPFLQKEKRGVFTKLSEHYVRRYENKEGQPDEEKQDI